MAKRARGQTGGPVEPLEQSKFLSPKQRQTIIKILTEKSKGRCCEMCGDTHWVLHSQAVGPVLLNITRDPDGVALDFQNTYPAAMLVCQSCGNAKMFMLRTLGIDIFKDPDS